MALCRQATGNCFVILTVFESTLSEYWKQTFTEFVDILRHNWSRKNWKTPLLQLLVSICHQCFELHQSRSLSVTKDLGGSLQCFGLTGRKIEDESLAGVSHNFDQSG